MKTYDTMSVNDFRMDVEKGRKIFQNVSINDGKCRSVFKELNFEKGTYFKDCYFGRVELDQCKLNNAIFDNSELNHLALFRTEANLIRFVNCKVTDLIIADSSLINGTLSGFENLPQKNRIITASKSNLKGVSFNSSYLEESIFKYCNLSEATFKGAIMRRTDLYNSEIQNSDFTGAKNLTMKLFAEINITPTVDLKYIGGISFENALKLFNLSFNTKELEEIRCWQAWTNIITSGTLIADWLKKSLQKYDSVLDQVYKLPSSEVPNEKELMYRVLKYDLRVKGIESLFE